MNATPGVLCPTQSLEVANLRPPHPNPNPNPDWRSIGQSSPCGLYSPRPSSFQPISGLSPQYRGRFSSIRRSIADREILALTLTLNLTLKLFRGHRCRSAAGRGGLYRGTRQILWSPCTDLEQTPAGDLLSRYTRMEPREAYGCPSAEYRRHRR